MALVGIIQAVRPKSQPGAATQDIVAVQMAGIMEAAEIIIEDILVGPIEAITDGDHIGPIGP